MLLFADSFDHYGISYITQKWHSIGGGFAISSTHPRTGPYCLQLLNTGSSWLTYIYGNTSTQYTAVGVAIRVGTIATPHQFLGLFTIGTQQVSVGIGSTGKLALYYSGGIAVNGTTTIIPNSWMYIELQCNFTTGGTTTVYLNGYQEMTYTGNLTGGATYIDRVAIGCSIGNSTTPGHFFDDFYLCDNTGSFNNAALLGPISVNNLLPNGASLVGNTHWTPTTGANYACVNEAQVDGDISYVQALTTGLIDTYTYTSLVGTPTIYGIQVNTIARKTAPAGTNSPLLVLRQAARTDTKTIYPLDIYTVLTSIYEQNPAGGSWVAATLSGMEIGIST